MIVIKRYPNRKLYNTEAKQYVTLDGIAQLIREREEIQILDHATGEDLTAVTLTQIIVEQEKKEGDEEKMKEKLGEHRGIQYVGLWSLE